MRFVLMTVFASSLALLIWVRPTDEPIHTQATVAIAVIRTIHTAEVQYQSEYGRYGDLRDLGPGGANLIPPDLSAGSTGGYRFTVTLGTRGYVVTAIPIDDRDPSFYSDQTLMIRRGTASSPASATSPELK